LAAPAPDDEVSVGYQTQSKRAFTGALTSVSPGDADARVPRLEELLQARVPGLEVLPLGNGNYTLRIRGHHSLRGNVTDDEPLLVIDDIAVLPGSLGTALAGVVPRDVARIDVLKDAGATAIYGSRGANGVIIITTKRGPRLGSP
jgi:TonB-dependent SusC/RagA subfamily outer membrane receptor